MENPLNKILLIIFCFYHTEIIFPQTTFTKINTGAIVNDGGVSFGCAWADYDNDGYIDLFVPNMSGAPGQRNFLYHNERNGTFTKIISGGIVNDSASSIGGSWGDYDNDGKLDLYVANFSSAQNNFLYHNDGGGNFTRILTGVIVTGGGSTNSCGWIDVNNDGLLDMCATNYREQRFLYINNSSGTFTRITTGSFITDISPSISSNWGDYNNDGKLDVFVANAGVITWPNFFYKNEGTNTFTKITNLIISIDTGKSFSGSWGDYNNDGNLDLFVANDEFRNNYLYRNNGDGTFTRIFTGSIATEGTYSVCGTWEDYNNDGYLDLFVSRWQNLNNYLYFNNGDETFTKVTTGDIVNDHGNSFGSCAGDYDNDGDPDIFVANINNENNFLYRNNATSENQNKWINIKCAGTVSNKSAIGAKVLVKANINGNPSWQLREISAQMGYNAQNDIRAHFGLGTASVIDSIKVIWPTGSSNIFTNVTPNQFITITENGGIVSADEKKNEVNKNYVLYQNYPNPFNPKTVISYSIIENLFVSLKVYDILGNDVATLVNEKQNSGNYSVDFNADNLSSGIYFYKLSLTSGSHNFVSTKTMLLIK